VLEEEERFGDKKGEKGKGKGEGWGIRKGGNKGQTGVVGT